MKKLFITFQILISFTALVKGQELKTLTNLAVVENELKVKETLVEGLKPNNEAKFIWAKNYEQKKSPIAFVYLHGFGASSREGEPVMGMLSKKYNANVYMSRLKEHGINRENSFEYLTPTNYVASAKEALEKGKLIGEKVILVSTSTGGTLSLKLASEDKSVLGLIMYSPFVGLINPAMAAITTKEGKDQFVEIIGSEIQYQKRPKEEAKYWSTIYHVNGYVALTTMLLNTMTVETFSKVNCPVFVGYYYKNEQEQDKVVSIPAILKMYENLGTTNNNKVKVAFPNADNHVIACDLRSNDWQSVYNKTVEFIDTIILK